MNTILTPAVIARLESEVCPTHGKKAVVFADKDVLSVSDACCPEFQQHLYDLCRELTGGSNEPHPLLKQMFGLK